MLQSLWCGKFQSALAPWCSGTSSTTEMGNASAFSNDAVLYDFAHRHASLEPWHCSACSACSASLHVLHSCVACCASLFFLAFLGNGHCIVYYYYCYYYYYYCVIRSHTPRQGLAYPFPGVRSWTTLIDPEGKKHCRQFQCATGLGL